VLVFAFRAPDSDPKTLRMPLNYDISEVNAINLFYFIADTAADYKLCILTRMLQK
jgi:hypothetical protein